MRIKEKITSFLLLGVLSFAGAQGQETLLLQSGEAELSPIRIIADSVFFTKEMSVRLAFDLEGSSLHYSLTQEEPSQTSSRYKEPLKITDTQTLKVRAFHPDYLPSEVSQKTFVNVKDCLSPERITLQPQAHENYPGGGAKTLLDQVKGSQNFRSPAWLGFAGGDVEIILDFAEIQSVSSVMLSFLSEQKSWIFLPESFEIYTSGREKDFTLAGKKTIVSTAEQSPTYFAFPEVNFAEQKADRVKVIIRNIPEIPSWHSGRGTAPWLFIDEVLIK